MAKNRFKTTFPCNSLFSFFFSYFIHFKTSDNFGTLVLDDHSRIVLNEKWTDADNDYINANFIKVSNEASLQRNILSYSYL